MDFIRRKINNEVKGKCFRDTKLQINLASSCIESKSDYTDGDSVRIITECYVTNYSFQDDVDYGNKYSNTKSHHFHMTVIADEFGSGVENQSFQRSTSFSPC